MTRADQLASALDDLLAVTPDVEAAAIVSADGLPMASALPDFVQEDRLAAMSAALLTLGERAAEGLNKGQLAQMYVEGSEGDVVLMAAGPEAVLVVMTVKTAKAGLVLFEMRSSAAHIASIMQRPAHEFSDDQESGAEQSSYSGEEPSPAEREISSVWGPPPTTEPEKAEQAPVWTGDSEPHDSSYSNW